MRRIFAPLLLLLATMAYAQPAAAQVSIGINAPGFSIGINLPVYPELEVVPGYPVYYAPNVNGDYFFYDGFYWVFNVEDGQWYSSSWYNGPWVYIEPIYVPQPILVVPYRFYRVRPAYWSGWGYDAPPRWGQHWGRDWEARRVNWDRWDRNRAAAAAPLPVYQRSYPRDRYPAPAQQVTIYNEHYKYQAKDQHVQQERAAIFRKQSAGGEKAAAKAERVEHPTATAPARDRQQRQETAPPPARSQRHETAQPPAAPRQEAPAVERAQPERGRKSEPQRAEPQNGAQRDQSAPQQAPRRERPQQETAQPPAAPRHEAPAQQAPRGERPPAQQPAVQQPPPAAQQPAKEERQQQREERQQERGNDRKQ
jgi:hypothetical protein